MRSNMKRILALLMAALLLALSFVLVACDEDETDESKSVMSYDNPDDGTFGVDFGELFGSGIELPDDEFE